MTPELEEVQEALQLAIVEHPAIFGLHPREVNPLVIFLQRRMDCNEADRDEEVIWQECFQRAKSTVEEKLLALLGCFAPIQADLAAELADIPEVKAPPEPKPVPAPRSLRNRADQARAAAPRARRNTSPQRGQSVTPKQIKFYGYLCHQLGQVPDYPEFAKLSLNQASARIKAMDDQVNGRVAAR
jgi:hypothetical protein